MVLKFWFVSLYFVQLE